MCHPGSKLHNAQITLLHYTQRRQFETFNFSFQQKLTSCSHCLPFFSIGLYWRRNLPSPLLNSHDTVFELVLNSLLCQDAVFAHCSFLLWFYTNGWARLCMARPWPPRGSGTGSCTLPPYGLWNHAAVPGGVRSSLIRLLLFALWNVVEGWRAAASSPFWEGVVFEQSRHCSIRSVLRHRCWEIFEPYCRPGPL